jgi:hypothetical protein
MEQGQPCIDFEEQNESDMKGIGLNRRKKTTYTS